MRSVLCVLLVASGVAASVLPALAIDGQISIYRSDYIGCSGTDLPPSPASLSLIVVAELIGASADGIRGAEYSISQSTDVDWLFVEDFTPATSAGAIMLGQSAINGLSPGVNIAWSDCQTGGGMYLPGIVPLQKIDVIDISGQFSDTYNELLVAAHSTPGNPFFRCPLVNLCDDPAFTKVCAGRNLHYDTCPFPPWANTCLYSTGGIFDINGPCGCLCVNVEERTWGGVKDLYR